MSRRAWFAFAAMSVLWGCSYLLIRIAVRGRMKVQFGLFDKNHLVSGRGQERNKQAYRGDKPPVATVHPVRRHLLPANRFGVLCPWLRRRDNVCGGGIS